MFQIQNSFVESLVPWLREAWNVDTRAENELLCLAASSVKGARGAVRIVSRMATSDENIRNASAWLHTRVKEVEPDL